MKVRTVRILDGGQPEFGSWTDDGLQALGDAGEMNQEAGFPCAWVEDQEHNRITPSDIIRAGDQLDAQGIYSAARRTVSNDTAGKLIKAIFQAESGE